MKNDNLILIAAAAVGLYFVSKSAKGMGMGMGASGGTSPSVTGSSRTTAIPNTALPGQPGWGWMYYSDGTSIGPDGKYYSGSTEVYDPNGYQKL